MPFSTRAWKFASFRAVVDALPEFLAGLEMGDEFVRYLHRRPGLGVAAGPRRTIVQGKAAEAPNLDTVTRGQCGGHLFQQLLDGQLHIPVVQLWVLGGEQTDEF